MDQPETPKRRPLFFLAGEIKSPPLSVKTRRRIGSLLDLVQNGVTLLMPISGPMPSIGPGVHELRISDKGGEWRVIYQVRPHMIYIEDVFAKKTRGTPKRVIERCQRLFEQTK